MKLITKFINESCTWLMIIHDYFGKYKYISNKGELKGNHRGSGSPFWFRACLRDTEMGDEHWFSHSSRKSSQDRFTARENHSNMIDYRCGFMNYQENIEAHVKGSFKFIFWSSGDDTRRLLLPSNSTGSHLPRFGTHCPCPSNSGCCPRKKNLQHKGLIWLKMIDKIERYDFSNHDYSWSGTWIWTGRNK